MSDKSLEFSNTLHAARTQFLLKHIWRHYKGGVYKVTNFSIDTDTLEARVEYRRIDGPDYNSEIEHDIFFSRPLREWFEDVDGVPRFIAVEAITRWEPVEA